MRHYITSILKTLTPALMGVVLGAQTLLADGFIQPSASLSAQEVVEVQLLGLQSDDKAAGIEQVWIFAHPDNKKVTGPLVRFARLFDAPAYAPMIGHVSYAIEPLDQHNGVARFVVQIQAQDGRSYGYLWVVRQVQSGPDAGFWMTSAVSAPRGGGAAS